MIKILGLKKKKKKRLAFVKSIKEGGERSISRKKTVIFLMVLLISLTWHPCYEHS